MTNLHTAGVQTFSVNSDVGGLIIAVNFNFPKVKEIIKEMSLSFPSHPPEDSPFEDYLVHWLEIVGYAGFVLYYQYCGLYPETFEKYDGLCSFDGRNGITLKDHWFDIIELDFKVCLDDN